MRIGKKEEESQRKILVRTSPRPHTLCWCVSRGERVTNGQKEGKRRLKSRIEKQVSMNGRNSETHTHTPNFAVQRERKIWVEVGGKKMQRKIGTPLVMCKNRHTSGHVQKQAHLWSCVKTFSVTVWTIMHSQINSSILKYRGTKGPEAHASWITARCNNWKFVMYST